MPPRGRIVALIIMISSFLILGSVMLAGKTLGRGIVKQQAELVAQYSQDEQNAPIIVEEISIASAAGIAIISFASLAAALALTILIHYRSVILHIE